MKRSEAIPHVQYVVDDSLNGRRLGEDQYANIQTRTDLHRADIIRTGKPHFKYQSVLVGWTTAYPPCPTCQNTLQNVIPADNSTERRCANCKTIWSVEFLFVSVHSYLDVKIENEEAEELARDYLDEIGVFGCNGSHCVDDGCMLNSRTADFVIR